MATTATMDIQDVTAEYRRIKDALWQERTTYDPHWRELADFVMPRRPRWFTTDRNRGDRRSQKIINETASLAHRTLKGGMHAGITSPNRPWMRLTTPDPDLAEFAPVKVWLHETTERLLWACLKSNLYSQLPSTYGDCGLFGTAAQGLLEDDQQIFRAYSYQVGTFAIGFDARGVLDTFVREYVMTVGQVVAEFGLEPVSQRIRDHYARHETEIPVDLCWLVYPNPEADGDPDEARFRSLWFEQGSHRDGKGLLRDRSYYEFPIQAPRWEVADGCYYGENAPAMLALGSIKALQTMERRKAQAVEKLVNPPLKAPIGMMNSRISSIPGDVTYDTGLGQTDQGVKPIYQVEPKVGELRQDIDQIVAIINRSFYVDQFQLISRRTGIQPLTEREVEEFREEKVFVLGPVFQQMDTELLTPMVDRIYALLARQGLIPEAPRELADVPLKVEYISVMAQALKLVGVTAQERFLAHAAQVASVWPSARYKVNAMQAIDDSADMLGVNPNLVLSDEDAKAAADADAQAAQAAQQAETMQKMALAGKTMSETEMGGDTALTRMQRALQP